MPLEIEMQRRAAGEVALRRLGKSIRHPFLRVGQLTQSDHQALIAKLPHGDVNPMQVMTPGVNYGKFYFLVDYSDPGGPDIIP